MLAESPHIIRLYDFVFTDDYACLVLEYAPNGDFFSHLSAKTKMSEAEARSYFLQLISGVEYLHQKMVAHHDLKLENLLIDGDFNLKISGFGLSAIMNDSYLLEQSCGTLHYAAPEVFSDRPYYGTQVDLWSCGVLLFAIVCGSFPFDDVNPVAVYDKIKSGKFEFPDMYLSAEFRDLVAGMLTVCPQDRMTIAKIRQHPWLLA